MYEAMSNSVLLDSLFRQADARWRLNGLHEEKGIICGNPLTKAQVLTYFPGLASKNVNKLLASSSPAEAAELFHQMYFAEAWGEESDDLLKFDTTNLDLLCSSRDEEGHTRHIYGQKFSDIADEEMTWLWPERIPSGTLIILSGTKSVGKTLCIIDWVSRVSSGSVWPDGSPNMQGAKKVLLCSKEDDPAKQTKQRLKVAGADLSNVIALEVGSQLKGHKNENKRNFDVKQDLAAITRLILDNPDISLLVLDPITSYIGGANINKDDEIRPLFDGLMAAAQRTGLTILALVHSNKRSDVDAVSKIMGASSVTAVARTVWTFAEDTEENGLYHMALAAGNNLKRKTGFEYRIVDAELEFGSKKHTYPKIQWGKESERNADDLLQAQREKTRSGGKNNKSLLAYALIREMIPAMAKDIYAKAVDEDISEDTVKAAKFKIPGLVTKKNCEGWWWFTPDNPPEWYSNKERIKKPDTEEVTIPEDIES
jgi:hypothetical protein